MANSYYTAEMNARAKGLGSVTPEQVDAILAQSRCGYCDVLLTPELRPQIDHIIPVCRALENRAEVGAIENLTRSCFRCNMAKGRKTPEEWAMLLWDRTSQFKTLESKNGPGYFGAHDPRWLRHLRRLNKERGIILAPQWREALIPLR